MEQVPPRTRHDFTSPLRYPGGKGMLARFMKLVMERNRLLDGHYAEVYAGGAGVAWSLLLSEYVQHVHINDIDPALHAFWTSVFEEPDELCRLIRDSKISIASWRRQRSILARASEHSALQVGFATFFLNRTNRSGIIRGGVIGGKQQTGTWKIDARFNRTDLISRIQKLARYRRRVTVYNLDAIKFLVGVAPQLPPKTLIYLDPPYYVKGGALYEHHYKHDDHAQVAQLVREMRERCWVVSYDATPKILELYKGHRHQLYDLSYSAQARYAGSEVIFFAPGLDVPKVENPARISA